jgi:hypothetical protein
MLNKLEYYKITSKAKEKKQMKKKTNTTYKPLSANTL